MMSRRQTCMSHSTRHPDQGARHNDSRTITKPKPKVRIIHVFAPEIIKTDVANFRELVQRLTGKPMGNECLKKARKRDESVKDGAGKMEVRAGLNGWGGRERVLKEEEDSGGLSGFSDLGGFLQDYSEFPLLSFDDSQIHCFEGTPFSSSLTS